MAMISSALSQCMVAVLPKLWASGVCGLEETTEHEIQLLLPQLLSLRSCGSCCVSQLCLSIRQPLHQLHLRPKPCV